ncbi:MULTISPECIES: glycine-rich domain-containing protein [Burkholderia cepacia complex]|uniref:glycine-rich domain-containing protein n=1 Tax=Burkholderia cepacia complex TaxID=87882 RepID=UPI0011B223F5|nr:MULTISPECIES: hypothetical protein [Burkholderia cepacia complex]MBR8084654.1 hypothetical protein [Burkholderia vietnamiensis]
MDRLIAANSVPMAQADTAPLTGTPQGATDGNPAANIPATRWPSYQYNAIQEELIGILTAAGISPDRTNNSQIAAAIKRLVQKTVILNDTGTANSYTAANTPPLTLATWVDGTVQQLKIANANTGASTYAPDGLTAVPIYGLGLQPLQGGELAAGGTAVLMRATIASVNSGNPICVLMECAGGAQQISPATRSLHALQLGQATGRLLRTTVYINSGGVLQSSVDGSAFANASSTFTPLALTTSVDVEVLGAGAAGGGAAPTGANQVSAGGGGGAGGYARKRIMSGFSGVTITVGAGGAASAGAAGASGGSSSFGSILSATGGVGGSLGNAASNTTNSLNGGSPGGNGSGGTINGVGGMGQAAFYAVTPVSGKGGSSLFGEGAFPVSGTLGGNAAQSYGAGGSGGSLTANSSGAAAGGNGSSGLVIVREYA